MDVNKLHIYCGDGKGKTTAAMGLALRALGHGERVMIVQFMKKGNSGELKAFERFENATCLLAAPQGFVSKMKPEEITKAAASQDGLAQYALEQLDALQPELVILDELCAAVTCGMVKEGAAWELITAALEQGEAVITGRNPPEQWLERADYVSEIVKRKHPFDKGLAARKGVEW